MVLGHWISTCIQRVKLHLCFLAHTKINSKWIITLHVRTKPIKFLKGNLWINIYVLKFENEFIYDTKSISNIRKTRETGLHQN